MLFRLYYFWMATKDARWMRKALPSLFTVDIISKWRLGLIRYEGGYPGWE